MDTDKDKTKDEKAQGFFGWQEPGVAAILVDSDGDGVLDTLVPCDDYSAEILKGKSIIDLLG
jgi:hypothetical protein